MKIPGENSHLYNYIPSDNYADILIHKTILQEVIPTLIHHTPQVIPSFEM